MSRAHRTPRTRRNALPAAVAIALLLLAISTPTPTAGCGMAMDRAPSGSVAAPDCCTDRSCPRMAVEPSRPEGMITATPHPWAPLSAVAIASPSATATAPLASLPSRIFRDRLLGPPLRI